MTRPYYKSRYAGQLICMLEHERSATWSKYKRRMAYGELIWGPIMALVIG